MRINAFDVRGKRRFGIGERQRRNSLLMQLQAFVTKMIYFPIFLSALP